MPLAGLLMALLAAPSAGAAADAQIRKTAAKPAKPVLEAPPPELVGPQPRLPEPERRLIPTVRIAPAIGWAPEQTPEPAPGLRVQRFADGLDHPRWLHVLPNGDVLVAETDRPADRSRGVADWARTQVMKRAGAAGPSADRISLLRDADQDGVAEERHVFIEGLHSPFGMARLGSTLYIANADALVSVPYADGVTQAGAAPTTVMPLPSGRNHHWTKNLLVAPDGRQLFVTVGSNSNVAEHGLAEEQGRAAIWRLDPEARTGRVFADGLRNPNGLAYAPGTDTLWTVVNERDGLGSNLVPDYLTSVREGAFYGWPWSWWGDHVDRRVKPPRPDRVAQAVAPDYALGAHVAALGLAASAGLDAWPAGFHQGLFIGEHGSWNRKPMSGYAVVFVPFADGVPAGSPVTVLQGFVNARGQAHGRPVGVAMDGHGGLLVADDVGNAVWRVSAEPPPAR